MPKIEPARAPVRPRVLSPITGETLLLEDALDPFVRSGKPGVICVYGPAGAGKTVALAHAASTVPPGSMTVLLDDARLEDVLELSDRLLVVYSSPRDLAVEHRAAFRLAPWGEDEYLEYLLAVHPEECGSVLRRLRSAPDEPPEATELVVACLDRMASDPSVAEFRTALRRHLDSFLDDLTRRGARVVCLDRLFKREGLLLEDLPLSSTQLRTIRHPRMHLLLAAEAVLDALRDGDEVPFLRSRLDRAFVEEIGRLAAADPAALDRLQALLAVWWLGSQAMVASLLHAARFPWRPDLTGTLSLRGAYLSGARWPKLTLPHSDLDQADLSGAILPQATLECASLLGASLVRANLEASFLRGLKADLANLSGAKLDRVQAEGARFEGADLTRASFEGATLQMAQFFNTRVEDARFRRADLRGARFLMSSIEGADFSGADLSGAILSGLDLRRADFTGARFAAAYLERSNLEGMSLPGACFDKATLRGALFTGATMKGASFRDACLRDAGLGDVDWEGADLRGADLRGATFHMGSSRSGLVFGEPMEGSRTGFYTDEYFDQTYRAPEEIRKANLCGADLRGAILEGVDFYLVDLRDAKFDDEQERLFRRCGAILESRP